MNMNDLLTLVLGLTTPWQIVCRKLGAEKKPSEFRQEVEADRGTLYACSVSETPNKVHDFRDFFATQKTREPTRERLNNRGNRFRSLQFSLRSLFENPKTRFQGNVK